MKRNPLRWRVVVAYTLAIFGWVLLSFTAIWLLSSLLDFPNIAAVKDSALPAGILVALGAQLLSQGKELKEKEEKRSPYVLSGNSGALLHRRPLRTQHATFAALGSSLDKGTLLRYPETLWC